LLPVGRVCPEIGEITRKLGTRRYRVVYFGINTPIERSDVPGVQFKLQLAKTWTTGIAEHQIKSFDALRRKIFHGFSTINSFQCHRGVEVIKDRLVDVRLKNQIARLRAIRTVGSDYGNVRVRQVTDGRRSHCVPICVKLRVSSSHLWSIAMSCVIRGIFLKEMNVASALFEHTEKASPKRGVSISPRRTHGQSKDDNFHIQATGECTPRFITSDARVQRFVTLLHLSPANEAEFNETGRPPRRGDGTGKQTA